MAASGMIFQRIESKFITDMDTAEKVIGDLKGLLCPTDHPDYSILGMYLDTDDFLLIRRSMEKPMYKEKFRLRCYGQPAENDNVFLEIKKKFDGVGNKRRIILPYSSAMAYINRRVTPPEAEKSKQIFSEIDRAFDYYDLKPKIIICYDRLAFTAADGSDFRLTFDRNIRCRLDDLVPAHSTYGDLLMDDRDFCIMEAKASGAFPLWFVNILNKYELRRQPFSKYANCYRKFVLNK